MDEPGGPRPLLQGTLCPTDVTIEGLMQAWPTLPASQALFTSEAGVLTQRPQRWCSTPPL